MPLKDPTNIPDPYVKLYLLPERNRDSKRRTDAIKDNCNPVYEQTFEYVVSPAELSSKQLEVSVGTRKGNLLSYSNVMGQVSKISFYLKVKTFFSKALHTFLFQILVNLNELDLSKTTTEWFDLLPEFSKDKDD